MRVLVEVHGHQVFQTFEGDVLAHGQTVEMFEGVAMQVPCITLDTGMGVRVIPLKTALTWTRITKRDDFGSDFR